MTLSTRAQKQLDRVVERLKVLDDHEGAIKQIEDELADLSTSIDKEVAKRVRALTGAGTSNYRGVFQDEEQARGFGLFMLSKSRDHDVAERARKLFDSEYSRAMDSVSDAALIPPEYSTRLKRLFESFGVWRRNAFRMPMNSDSLTFLKETGEPTVYLLSENTAGTQSDPTFANVNLNAKEWGTLTYAPLTLVEDSAAELGELLAVSIVRAFARKEDNAAFNGDGTATYFGISGFRQRLQNVNGVDDGGGLVLGSGNAWSELVEADFTKLAGLLPEYPGIEPKWFCSKTFYWNVIVPVILSAGGVTAEEMEGIRRRTFYGHQVEFVQTMPKADANSQIPLLHGDLSLASTLDDRNMLSIRQSSDYKFAERQMTYLAVQRIAVSIEDVGTDTEAGPVVGLITANS